MERMPTFPGWETVEVLGSGAFSKVYKIKKNDNSGDFFSAMKVISVPGNRDEYNSYKREGYTDENITTILKEKTDNIVNEFKLMSRFRGMTNFVSYEDHTIIPHENEVGWDVLIRMELLTPLTDYYPQMASDEKAIIKLGRDICQALEVCSKRGVVHRDIKPANIFVNDFGDFKIGDFGVSKVIDHTTHATKVGTPVYMAPEVFYGKPYNSSADVYSLGMVLYWLLNERRLPFVPLPPAIPTISQSDEANVRRLSGEAIPAPKNGSNRLKEIVLKACAYDTAKRYKSAAELNAALHALLTGNKSVAIPATNNVTQTVVTPNPRQYSYDKNPEAQLREPDKPQDEKKSNKLLLFLVLSVCLVGITLGLYVLLGNQDTSTTPHSDDEHDNTSVIANIQPNISDVISQEESPVVAESIAFNNGDLKLYIGDSDFTIKYTVSPSDTTDKTVKWSSSDTAVVEVDNGVLSVKGVGTATVSAVCGDAKASFKVEVNLPGYKEIKIVSLPSKLIYNVGEQLDLSGLSVSAYLHDGKVETDVACTCDYPDMTTSGSKIVYVEYGGLKASFNITVNEKRGIGEVSVGDIVKFGSYEQDNVTSNGKEDIEWIVLDINNGKAMLISKDCLDFVRYNATDDDTDWESSYIRSWLNDEFYYKAFSEEERSVIIQSDLDNKSLISSVDGGPDTLDKVFLLSASEVNKYFPTPEDKGCTSTPYAISLGAYVNPDRNNNTWWWLRSLGDFQNIAARISSSGYIKTDAYVWENAYNAVRPVIWVETTNS